MKKAYLLISALLLSSIFFAGCGKKEINENNIPKASSNSPRAEEISSLPTESVPETPEPTEAAFSPEQGYSDSRHGVTILGLKEYKKIESAQYTDKAKKGKKYLALFLEIENKGNDTDYFHADYLTAKVDGKEIHNTFLLNEPEGYPTIFTNIAPGAVQSGFAVWEVSAGWKKIEVAYDGWRAGEGLSLHTELGRGDLKAPEKFKPKA